MAVAARQLHHLLALYPHDFPRLGGPVIVADAPQGRFVVHAPREDGPVQFKRAAVHSTAFHLDHVLRQGGKRRRT
eukprot:9495548-Pyramimonas_sp.AAC.1